MAAALLSLVLFWPLLVAGLLLPGYLLARIVPSRAPILSAFLGSLVVLFGLVLVLDFIHQPLALDSLAIGFVLVDTTLLLISLRFQGRAGSGGEPGSTFRPRGLGWLWAASPAIALVAITVRAIGDPLSGWDNYFRWDFLARQMLRYGTLSFYPPMTAEDFTHYGWCDGIPPLVPVLNCWSYLSAGSLNKLATAPRVVLEAGLLIYAVWRLARGLWGAAAGWPATAVLATSALALQSIAMGQETGLTALTLVAMFVFLDEHRRGGGSACLFWAGLAAGVGGLSREYGLAWTVIGFGTLAWHGRARAAVKIFVPVAISIAAPWYLRNWLHTGNPLYAQSVAGIFPSNSVHLDIMRLFAEHLGISHNLQLLPFAVASLTAIAGAAGVLGLWGLVRAPRAAGPIGAAAIVVILLWLWSIGQTAGGWIYSARVLNPAVALFAVAAAGPLTRLSARTGRRVPLVISARLPADKSVLLPSQATAGIRLDRFYPVQATISGSHRPRGRIALYHR